MQGHTHGDTPERKVRKPSRAPEFRRSYTASAALHDALRWMFPPPLWEGEGKLSLGGMSTLFFGIFYYYFTLLNRHLPEGRSVVDRFYSHTKTHTLFR